MTDIMHFVLPHDYTIDLTKTHYMHHISENIYSIVCLYFQIY